MGPFPSAIASETPVTREPGLPTHLLTGLGFSVKGLGSGIRGELKVSL